MEDKGALAAVKIETGDCGECHACGFGAVKNRKSMEVYASNEAGAKTGDRVILEASDRKVVSASAIIFLIPFFAFLTGILIGYFPLWYLFDAARVPVALICGFLFLGGSLYLVHVLGNRSEFVFVIRGVTSEIEPPPEKGNGSRDHSGHLLSGKTPGNR